MVKSIYIACGLAALCLLNPGAVSAQKGVGKNIYSDERKKALGNYLFDSFDEKHGQLDSIRNSMVLLMQKGAYNDIIDISKIIYDRAHKSGRERVVMTSALFIGQSYCMMAMADSMNRYISEALHYAEKYDDAFTISRIYNSLGIYSVINEMDFAKGLRYYHKAMDAAERLDDDFYLAIKSNLAYVYYYRKDPVGLKYAQEVYNEGKKGTNRFRIYNGAFVSAYMYFLLEDYPEALRYVEETLEIVDDYYGQTHVYTLMGDILNAMGDKRGAKASYLKAFEYYDETEASILVDAFVSYGSFLLETGSIETAIDVLEMGVDFALENSISITRYKLYETISEAYGKLGYNGRALDYYKLFHIESDSIFNVERERSINELRISYEAEKREKELQRKELQLIKERQGRYFLISALAVILIALITFYIYYRRQNKLYLHIVKNYRELKRGAPLVFADFQLIKNSEENQDSETDILFKALEEKMRKERIYRDNDLTADKLASVMNVNRPYLSKVIGKHSNKNYNGYINSYRIQEAVEVLSDRDRDIPLKALSRELGFNSLSVFYAAFKEIIGVSPSKFRENWRKIDEDDPLGKVS